MKPSWTRVRRGIVVLGVVVVASVVGYRIAGRDWLDALYMVVITLSTVGYGEHSNLPPGEKWLTIGVIVFGILALGYTVGGMIQMLTEGEVERALTVRRILHDVQQLKEHIIICGFGRIGRILAEEFRGEKRKYVIVERDHEHVWRGMDAGQLIFQGDSTSEEVLLRAGIEQASTLITTLPDDADNVFITLTARNLNRNLQIIARAESTSTHKKLLQAGANQVVMPATIGAARMVRMVTHPSTVELLELAAERSVLDVQMDEFKLPHNSPIIGQSVGEIAARRRHGLLLAAVKRKAGELVFNPGAEHIFEPEDIVIVMGSAADIQRFRVEFSGS